MTSAIAEVLWTARTSGGLVARDADGVPETDDDAYAIQTAQIALSEGPRIGWKLGATGSQSLALLALDEPFFGPLFDQYRVDSGADVALPAAHGPGIETEFTVVLGADLPAREAPYARPEVDAAVAAVCPSFEIVALRFEGGAAGAGRLAIADGGANLVTVLGTPVTDWQRFDLTDHPVRLDINGSQAAEGSNRVLLWDHTMDAVVWLANHPRFAGRGLKAGEIIMTGTCTGLIPLEAGDEAAADFGAMGEVRARFV